MQRAIHLLQRLAPLLVGLGRDQIGDALGFGEVELAVLEGAAGEFAGLGQPAHIQLPNRLERSGDDGAATVQVQLGHHLAGLAVGRFEPHHQAAVDRLAAQRIVERAHDHAAGLRQRRIARRMTALEGARLGEEHEDVGGARPTQANDREGAGMCARGLRRAQRVDRGGVHPGSGFYVRFCGAGRGAGGAAGGGRAITLSEIFS